MTTCTKYPIGSNALLETHCIFSFFEECRGKEVRLITSKITEKGWQNWSIVHSMYSQSKIDISETHSVMKSSSSSSSGSDSESSQGLLQGKSNMNEINKYQTIKDWLFEVFVNISVCLCTLSFIHIDNQILKQLKLYFWTYITFMSGDVSRLIKNILFNTCTWTALVIPSTIRM